MVQPKVRAVNVGISTLNALISSKGHRQTKITQHAIQLINPTRKTRLNKKLAFALYKTRKPFTTFEDDAQTNFFAEFGYKPPSSSKLSTTLLDDCYTKIETAVEVQLSPSNTLNLVTDESTDISNNRIINTFVITNNSSFFYISNLEAEPGKLGAEEVIDHAIAQAKKFTKGDLSKLASQTTDTCAT